MKLQEALRGISATLYFGPNLSTTVLCKDPFTHTLRWAALRVVVLRCAVRELVATFYRPLRWDALRCASTSNYVHS